MRYLGEIIMNCQTVSIYVSILYLWKGNTSFYAKLEILLSSGPIITFADSCLKLQILARQQAQREEELSQSHRHILALQVSMFTIIFLSLLTKNLTWDVLFIGRN